MDRVLVLGYGNPLRSDDSLGWQVAVQLFRTNQAADVEVVPCHQLTPESAETISRADTVRFIDCAKNGVPGEFHCQEIHWQTGSISFTHDLSPSALLDLASQLFGFCPRAFLLTIWGECFATGETLSPAVNREIPKLKECVRELIAECQMDALTR